MQKSEEKPPCCSPSPEGPITKSRSAPDSGDDHPPRAPRAIFNQSKAFRGTATPLIADDGEAPIRKTTLRAFEIGKTTVTNLEFAAFVDATGYQTDAENYGWSFVFQPNADVSRSDFQSVPGAEWWTRVDGANWRDIDGPGTQNKSWDPAHPVVHVSWRDAKAYAKWAGGRLPTETEWEHAARSGTNEDIRFPWGNEDPNDTDYFPCNIWQGRFPDLNTAADGWIATSPSMSFMPNAAGLYNMVGNVWEWTSDTYKVRSLKKNVRQRLNAMKGFKVLKGGSFLCHRSYCYRYRIAARTGNTMDSTTNHQGFRMVWDRERPKT